VSSEKFGGDMLSRFGNLVWVEGSLQGLLHLGQIYVEMIDDVVTHSNITTSPPLANPLSPGQRDHHHHHPNYHHHPSHETSSPLP
jgi:hypothetical protein